MGIPIRQNNIFEQARLLTKDWTQTKKMQRKSICKNVENLFDLNKNTGKKNKKKDKI